MKKILFATTNLTKSKRFADKLKEFGIETITLRDIDTNIEVEENGNNAIENALIKARAYYKETNMPVMAMDDNLYLEGVPEENQPGMFVRRVNGKTLNDEEMLEHYISLVKKYGKNGILNSKWVYGMAVINNDKEYTYTWNKGGFYMVETPSEKTNPGYPLNSISKDEITNKYFTELTNEDKSKSTYTEDDVVEFIVNSMK